MSASSKRPSRATMKQRRLFRYERMGQELLARPHFLRRVAAHFLLVVVLVSVSLLLGMIGYVYFERLSWIDAFLNAAMLLGGMGPVNNPQTYAGKLFAGTYALYAGLVVLIGAGFIVAPLFHRIMHRFHLEEDTG